MDDRYLNLRYEMAGRVVDPVAGTVTGHGEDHALSRKQLEVLALLASAEGRPVPREDFIDQIWDGDRLVGERGLTDTIYTLRRSLRVSRSDGPLIRTIPRHGYQLHVEVRWADGDGGPDDGYPSALELKRDLERRLADRPVETPETGPNPLGKLARRHRVAVASASLVTLALLATTAAALVGFVRAEREAAKARAAAREAEKAAELQIAQLRAIDASAMGVDLRDTLRESVREQLHERGSEPAEIETATRRLERLLRGVSFTDLAQDQLATYVFEPTLRAIETEYDDVPLLQARLWQAAADTLRELGDFERAIEPQNLALERRRALLGDDARPTLGSLQSRGELYLALGRLDEAEADLRAAVEGSGRSLGDHDPQTLASIDALGVLLLKTGELDEAESLLREALDGRRRILGDDHPDTLRSVASMARLAETTGLERTATEPGRR